MDPIKQKMVEEATMYVNILLLHIKDVEGMLAKAPPSNKPEIRRRLEDMRIQFSQILGNLVIFKAKHGLFSSVKKLK